MIVDLDLKHDPSLFDLSEALRTDPSPCSYWSLTTERTNVWRADEDRVDLVLISEETVTGIGSLQRGGRHQRHLGEISVAVHPDFRRSGCAGSLVSELEDRARSTSIVIIKARIWVENHASRKLFASLGYEHKATLMAEFLSDQIGEIDDAVYYKRL